MGLVSSAIRLFGGTRTHEAAQSKASYGVIERRANYIKVYAPSGEEALRLAGADGMTPEGANFLSANHQGNGIFYIELEQWSGW